MDEAITATTIADYIGRRVSSLLKVAPFKDWPVTRSINDDLGERIIHYIFKEHGLELRCDRNDNISVIFLYSNDHIGFDGPPFEIPFSWNREQVLERFGPPAKSGRKTSLPFLGDHGAWNRFTQRKYTIHMEYRVESDGIELITLMRNDVIP